MSDMSCCGSEGEGSDKGTPRGSGLKGKNKRRGSKGEESANRKRSRSHSVSGHREPEGGEVPYRDNREEGCKTAAGGKGGKEAKVSVSFLSRMGKVVGELREVLLSEETRMTKKAAKEVLDSVALLERIIGEQSEEIARLRGRLEERKSAPQPVAQPRLERSPMLPPVASPRSFPPLRSPLVSREITYALVARAEAADTTPGKGEIKEKVLEAGKKMGAVKVKGVRELKDGGVAIIARSAVELRKIKEAPAFKEAGIKLSVPKMAEPKLLVLEVPSDLSNEVIIGEIMRNNLQGVASNEDIQKIRAVNRLSRKGGKCAIVVEAPSKIREYLLAEGRIYVGFSSLRIREYEDVPRCYGCGGFGHMLVRCPTGRLCHNCGEAGHGINACKAPAKCRNCAVRGLEASHRIASPSCPCFLREVERRRGFVIG